MANNQILTSGSLNPSSPETGNKKKRDANFAQERAVQWMADHMQTKAIHLWPEPRLSPRTLLAIRHSIRQRWIQQTLNVESLKSLQTIFRLIFWQRIYWKRRQSETTNDTNGTTHDTHSSLVIGGIPVGRHSQRHIYFNAITHLARIRSFISQNDSSYV